MVKSGEVYFHNGDPLQESSRPRLIFNPSENFCGLATYIQDQIFKDIKHNFISFCHGDSCTSYVDRIKSILDGKDLSSYSSVSMDGSAFDSNQHAALIEAVDVQFFAHIQQRIRDIVEYVFDQEQIVGDVDNVLQGIMQQATQVDTWAFFDLPLVNKDKWVDSMSKRDHG